jgi:VWFA-related protein
MRRLAVFAAVATTAATLAVSQETEPLIRVDVDLVNVLFSVRDKKGALVPNLTKDDFKVYEDGKEQTIRTFARESDLPLTIGLLVDVSGSQRNLIEVEKHAAIQFFQQVLRPKDMAFLISFGSEAELLQDSTNSVGLLSKGTGRTEGQQQPRRIRSGPRADHQQHASRDNPVRRGIARRNREAESGGGA